jgi:hypothetical protein
MNALFIFAYIAAAVIAVPTVPFTIGDKCTRDVGCEFYQCFLPSPTSNEGYCMPTIAGLGKYCSPTNICGHGLSCSITSKTRYPDGYCAKKDISKIGYAKLGDTCSNKLETLPCEPNAHCLQGKCIATQHIEGYECGGDVKYPFQCYDDYRCIQKEGSNQPGFCVKV